jgi:cytosine/uracil/thiamine/allantoin permease
VWTQLYHYAWFLSFATSFAVYAALMRAAVGPFSYSS